MQFGFPKSSRILKSAEFDYVFSHRCSFADGLIVVYAAPSQAQQPRLGLVVSKKCGNAVKRNRWKRALREAFRLVKHNLPRQLDLVVLPRANAEPNVARLQNSLVQLAERAHKKLARTASEGDG